MAPDLHPPAAELISLALAAPEESEERWHHIRRLQRRGDRPTFDAASALCQSVDAERRELGVDILAQLGTSSPEADPALHDPTVDLLLELLATEQAVTVLSAIATAFGHLDEPRAIGPLTRLSDHVDEDVRYAVVFGLLGHDDDRAVDTLVKLSADSDADVRDWATFGLGEMSERDTPQVREALAVRVDDPDDDTRDEALSGLAARGDRRAIVPLLSRLEEAEGPLLDEALYGLAAATGDARLCAHVAIRWHDRVSKDEASPLDPAGNTQDELLLAAAERCELPGPLASG
jgi:HEAT repeat protein